MPVLGDRLRAGHRDLEYPVPHVAPGAAERLLDLPRIDRGRPARGGRRRSPKGGRARGQSLTQSPGELDRVAMAFVVHVHDVGRHLVQVIVNRGHLEAAAEEAGHHGRNLLVQQHEIPHHHGPIAGLLEGRVRAEREPRLHRHALHVDGQIRARHSDPEDVAGLDLAGLAERLLDRLPVGLGRSGAGPEEQAPRQSRKREMANRESHGVTFLPPAGPLPWRSAGYS